MSRIPWLYRFGIDQTDLVTLVFNRRITMDSAPVSYQRRSFEDRFELSDLKSFLIKVKTRLAFPCPAAKPGTGLEKAGVSPLSILCAFLI
jgi:hypothetical protein